MLPDAPAFSFNLSVDLRAAAVAYARNAIEVVAAVDHARARGLRVAPQATGHNVGAYGSLDDAVLVDVRNLQEISIDTEANARPRPVLGAARRQRQLRRRHGARVRRVPARGALRRRDVLPVRARGRGAAHLGRPAAEPASGAHVLGLAAALPGRAVGAGARARRILRRGSTAPISARSRRGASSCARCDLGPVFDTFAMVPPGALGELAMDPPDPLPYHSAHQMLGDLPPDAVDAILAAAGPGSGAPIAMVQLRHLGGALARVSPGAGARATLPGEVCPYALGVPADEPVRASLEALERAMLPYRAGDYPNFVEEPVDTSRFFDAATWARLQRVKAHYDPADLFRGNHRIPPAEAEGRLAA